MFNINFEMFEMFEVVFEVYIENNLANKQVMQAPKEILMVNFMQTADQIGKDKRPMMIKMSRPEVIWDTFENKQKTLNHEVEFCNNAMIAWRKDNQND